MLELSRKLLSVVDATELRLRMIDEAESEKPVLRGGWSRKQVIGHLIDSASNNHQRFVRAMLQGELIAPGTTRLEMCGFRQCRRRTGC